LVRRSQVSSTDSVWETRGTFDGKWPSLGWSARECNEIERIHREVFPDAERIVLTGSEASEERVKQECQGIGTVHFATHGYFEPQELPSMLERASRGSTEEPWPPGVRRPRKGLPPGLLSGLALAGSNLEPTPGRENGLLTS